MLDEPWQPRQEPKHELAYEPENSTPPASASRAPARNHPRPDQPKRPTFNAACWNWPSYKVSVAQRGWLEVLGRSTGLEVRLWRPGDWTEIVELLQR
jgi:hypothetical protein